MKSLPTELERLWCRYVGQVPLQTVCDLPRGRECMWEYWTSWRKRSRGDCNSECTIVCRLQMLDHQGDQHSLTEYDVHDSQVFVPSYSRSITFQIQAALDNNSFHKHSSVTLGDNVNCRGASRTSCTATQVSLGFHLVIPSGHHVHESFPKVLPRRRLVRISQDRMTI